MKILHIAYFGRSGKLNGIYEAVTCLANAQIKLNNDVKIAITTKQSVVDEQYIYYTPTTKKLRLYLIVTSLISWCLTLCTKYNR